MPEIVSDESSVAEALPDILPVLPLKDAVIFPYIRMGRSISGFTIDRTGGRFGPFEDQMFLGDYTLSIIMRATTEQVNGVWQGACYPFREGLSTGLLDVTFTPEGRLLCGGTRCPRTQEADAKKGEAARALPSGSPVPGLA